jgi:hypothetical protein
LTRRLFSLHSLAILYFATSWAHAQGIGKIAVDLVDEQSGEPLVCRVKLIGPNEKPLRVRGALHQSGWNLVKSPLKYEGKAGDFQYEISHGPRYSRASGGFTLDRKSEAIDVVKLPGHCDLQSEGWYGGDLLSFVKPEESLQWLVAEDLSMAVFLPGEASPKNDSTKPASKTIVKESPQPTSVTSKRLEGDNSRWVDSNSYRYLQSNNGLTIHHWQPPADLKTPFVASELIDQASDSPETFIEIQRLWAPEVPLWLASGKVHGVQLLGDHLTIDGEGTQPIDPPVKLERTYPRDQRGAGRMVENLYWKLLDTGLRIPPTAGSAFGRSHSPLGYNRVYTKPGSIIPDRWWNALRAGDCFVTNGPLLRVSVNDCPPGFVFTGNKGQPVELTIRLVLTVADPVEYLDVVFNGQTLYQARLDEHAKRGGKIPTQSIQESGWLVVRVVTERDFTYRMATTAPFYVEFDGQPRISEKAVTLFNQWLESTASQIEKGPAAIRTANAPYLAAAKEFWSERLVKSNAE